MDSKDLHIFFLPFLAPGHMLPMVDMARLFAARGVKATIVTTTANAAVISQAIDGANSTLSQSITVLILSFPATEAGLPDGHENVTFLPNPDVSPAFIAAINLLESPFRSLVDEHRPDCIVSDIFYTWSAYLGVPRVVFHGTSAFSTVVSGAVARILLQESFAAVDESFVVRGLPHRIEISPFKVPEMLREMNEGTKSMGDSFRSSLGMVMNTFYELEPGYVDMLRSSGQKIWNVGPVSLCNQDFHDNAARGSNSSSGAVQKSMNWLDCQKPGSVFYICFGSLGRFTEAQLTELAAGLAASGHPFLWVVRKGDESLVEELLKDDEKEGKFSLIVGWAPQTLILSHEAVGGFMTHCGWNSSLESICAGVPIVAWPLFAEQPFNERLLVDVLGVGVEVGVRRCSLKEEERGVVGREEVRRAAEEVMGGGEAAEERRKRARAMKEKARSAAEEGGSSYDGLSGLIEDVVGLIRLKMTGRIEV